MKRADDMTKETEELERFLLDRAETKARATNSYLALASHALGGR
ncbi:MAG: hypothetical protein AB7R40_24245 [Nitrospiraceae bacterium]